MSAPTTTTTTTTFCSVGIDLGSESTKIVLGASQACEIVRSASGLHTTPTRVGFAGKLRHVGETAAGSGSIAQLVRLLSLQAKETTSTESLSLVRLEDFYPFEYSNASNVDNTTDGDDEVTTTTVVKVDYNGERRSFPAAALLAMLLGQIQASVVTTLERLQVQNPEIYYTLVIPPGTLPQVQEQLLDAAYAAGLDQRVQLVETPVAYALAYQRKFPHLVEFSTDKEDSNTTDENNNLGTANDVKKNVLIVDMGHSQTTVTIVQFGETETSDTGTDDDKDTEDDKSAPWKILSSHTHTSLGAANGQVRLWRHFQSTVPALNHVTETSRAGQRLAQGTHKLLHLLSQLPSGQVTVENVGQNDTDVTLQATRQTLVDLCQPDAAALTALIQAARQQAGDDTSFHALEIVGGGCRIPWVQATIQEAMRMNAQGVLSKSLDDTSAALGAALVGDAVIAKEAPASSWVLSVPEPNPAALERRQQLRDQEVIMAALDVAEKAKANHLNQIEAKILELRSAKHDGTHGKLLPGAQLDDYLQQVEDWLFSADSEDATLEQVEQKHQDVLSRTQEICADYYQAKQSDELAKEQEMEKVAHEARLEQQQEGNGENGEEDDHDNRRLPKKRRMEIVLKNKAEANELFKDGNWRFAAARYTKALTHCAKFVDLSPDDEKEVRDLKVALNLNLALAYSKLEQLDQALRVSNEAIALDYASPKAYYRRASVWYEKKRWDEAKQDVVQAKKLLDGKEDKAIQKLSDRIELQLKRQKQKEKKMASKMFG